MRKKEIRLILASCAVSVAAIMLAFTAFAATLNVPGTYATINEAIDAANAEDTVLCQPKDYTETELPVNFDGKAITVECADPRDCIIDCDSNVEYGVVFVNNEGSSSVLTGFTIQEGDTAAIYCDLASPTISDCLLHWNDNSYCGGIEAYDSSPTISNCDIEYNWFNYAGGACFFGGSPTISNSDFYHNFGAFAGGIYFEDSSPALSGCNITYNSAAFDESWDVAGGAVFFGGSPTITGGSISHNTAWGAGGIYNAAALASLTMTGVTVSYNSGYDVGGILCEDASPTLTGCTISYNSNFWPVFGYPKLGTGGAHFLGGSPTITGGTVTYNSGWNVGGIANWDSPASLTISGAAVTFNSGYYTGGIETWDAS
ncbi:MAG: right-handed parallel beta-helix repeat-containing protein, partial [Deltaproteobacteria bacterium]|nr:right-handed parallel beta-helix repeat-containing protein [Deltaproteobacteria bacterium]